MIERKKILVTGANGQLGMELRQLEKNFPPFQFIFFDKDAWPIHDIGKGDLLLDQHRPAYLINAAAYTAVDKAEQEKDLAFEINASAPGQLAALCKKYDVAFIHISTDYVFDGNADEPYKENDATNPQSVYGASKLEGEKRVMIADPASIIIRSSWVYSSFGKNFVKTILRLLREKDEIGVVSDQMGSPTYAADLANTILQIINSDWQAGIYHYCNDGIISWYEFALYIKELCGSSCTVKAISTDQYPTAAKRPSFSALDNSKIKKTFNITHHEWKESLSDCLKLLSH